MSFANSLTTSYCNALVTQAHSAGIKALISVAEYDGLGFAGATGPTNRAAFITNLTNFMAARGYDGIDIDWEPLSTPDASQYTNFIKELRTALNGFNPPRLLTAATAKQPAWFAALQGELDQINLMTYSLSGAWPGWVTWFNAPLYDAGYRFPSTGGLVPSTDGMVRKFIDAGVSPSKLAIGIPFYATMWSGGAGTSTGGTALPRQSWTNAPTTGAISYSTLMSSYYQPGLYHWDPEAQAAYLSIDSTSSGNDKFISFDDPRACLSKVSYARNMGLGGVMIWELGQGYNSSLPAGQRDPLLQSIKRGMTATPDIVSIDYVNQNLQLVFETLPLGLYRVEWTTNVQAGPWVTLTNNVPGDGNPTLVSDPAPLTQSGSRFYRIQTPP